MWTTQKTNINLFPLLSFLIWGLHIFSWQYYFLSMPINSHPLILRAWLGCYTHFLRSVEDPYVTKLLILCPQKFILIVNWSFPNSIVYHLGRNYIESYTSCTYDISYIWNYIEPLKNYFQILSLILSVSVNKPKNNTLLKSPILHYRNHYIVPIKLLRVRWRYGFKIGISRGICV